MVSVSASVNLPLHHKVQKFSSGTGSPRWSQTKGHKTVVVVVVLLWKNTYNVKYLKNGARYAYLTVIDKLFGSMACFFQVNQPKEDISDSKLLTDVAMATKFWSKWAKISQKWSYQCRLLFSDRFLLTVGQINMKVGTQVGLGPGHIVLDGDPAPPQKGAQPPIFGPCLLWPNSRPSQLLLSSCWLTLRNDVCVFQLQA